MRMGLGLSITNMHRIPPTSPGSGTPSAPTFAASSPTYNTILAQLTGMQGTPTSWEARYRIGSGSWTTVSLASATDSFIVSSGNYEVQGRYTNASGISDWSSSVTGVVVANEQVATPGVSVSGGTYNDTQSVSLTCATSGATIYYTLDGSTPTTGSTEYTSAISILVSKTLKAIAVKTGMDNSSVRTAVYTIKVATPYFDPTNFGLVYAPAVSILCATAGVDIYYTTDGSTPTTSSSLYLDPVQLSQNVTTLKAIAVKSGWANSDVYSLLYTLGSPTIALSGYNYPFTVPGDSGSCWADPGSAARLTVTVSRHDSGVDSYIEVGYYFESAWVKLNGRSNDGDLQVDLTYHTSYDLQARYVNLSESPTAFGIPGTAISVTAPYKEIDGLGIVAAGDGYYHDSIAFWNSIPSGNAVSLSWNIMGEIWTYDGTDLYYRNALDGGTHGIPAFGTSDYTLYAWYTGDIYSFKKSLSGYYSSMPTMSLGLQSGTSDWPTVNPGQGGSCWNGDGISNVNFLTDAVITSGYSLSLSVDWGSGPSSLGSINYSGGWSFNLAGVGTPYGTYFEISGDIVSDIDSAVVKNTGSLVSSTTPIETPSLIVSAATDGTDVTLTINAYFVGTIPSGDFSYNFYDPTNLTSDPFSETVTISVATAGFYRTSTMEISYSSTPAVDDPYQLTYFADDLALPPSILNSINSTYVAV